jgi:hypothetical protein
MFQKVTSIVDWIVSPLHGGPRKKDVKVPSSGWRGQKQPSSMSTAASLDVKRFEAQRH